jgi:hypothetical protein
LQPALLPSDPSLLDGSGRDGIGEKPKSPSISKMQLPPIPLKIKNNQPCGRLIQRVATGLKSGG